MVNTETNSVILEIPRGREFSPILHMVLGGIGLRRNLSFDSLDDMQLAVDSIIDGDHGSSGKTLTMRVDIREDLIGIDLQGLENGDLRDTLEEGRVPEGAESRCLDVCVLLRSLVDGYTVRDVEGGAFAVTLQKSVR